MPSFDVRCEKCGWKTEILALATAAETVLRKYGHPCPVAGCGGRMRPVPARSSFVIKGNGGAE